MNPPDITHLIDSRIDAKLERHEADGLLWSTLAAFTFGVLCGIAGAFVVLWRFGLL